MLARGGLAASAGSRGPEAGEDAGADAEQALRLLLGDRCEEALDAGTLRQVLPLLRHPEPTFRELTLRALALAPRKLVVLFRESESRTGVADVLLGVASADERMENRCLAGTVLGRLLPAFEHDSRRQRLEADATAAVFDLFRDAFERQSLHHALAAATAVAPYLERAVQHQGPDSPLVQIFVRESLKVISSAVSAAGPITLASSRASELQHPLLLATLLRILREHLRDTEFNRRTFVEPFREFVHQIFVVKRGPAQWVNREAPEFLRNEASWFLCKWFQIPNDDFIVRLGPAVIRAYVRSTARGGLHAHLKARMKSSSSKYDDACLSDVRQLERRRKARQAKGHSPPQKKHHDSFNYLQFSAQGGYIPRRFSLLANEPTTTRAKGGSFESKSMQAQSAMSLSDATYGTKANATNSTRVVTSANHDHDADENSSDDDETDDDETELPPGLLTNLTFQMAVPSVELSGTKREVILHLTNPGNQAELFALQTFPSTNFAAVPAFGVVAAKSSMPICVRFVQDMSDPSLTGACVRGFLRVRSRHGVAGERVALSAYHGPLLEVLDTELSFGHLSCARGSNRERTLPLIVRNRAKAPCNASFQAVEDHDAVFLVRQSQALIMPGEELWVDVTFRPRECKGYSDTILVSAPGGEVHRIQVSGHGSSPLRVHEEELEFGIIQLDHANGASATKTFRVENLDPSQSIPVSFSSDRPTEVFAEQTTLKPREVREITVRLRTLFTGAFQALLVIASPTCESVSVTLQGFVGNLVTIPLSPNIGLPVQPTGATATFELPLKNYYSSPVELYLTGFEDSPCAAFFQSPTQETLELREGVTVVMHPFEDVSLELRFSSTKPGLFRLPVRLELMHPHRATFGPWYLTIPCTGEDVSGDQRRLKAKRLDFANLRRLLAVSISHEHPAQELTEHEEALDVEEDEQNDSCTPTDEIPSSASPDGFVAHETNLLISQRVTPVFGNPCQNERPRATVEVRNTSSVSQPFKALVSSPFVLRQPSLQEGFVDPHDVLRLEVEIDASLESVTLGPTWGFLSILAEKGGHLRPLCSTLLQGAATAPIHLSCPDDGLIFRGVHRDESATRLLRASNHTPCLAKMTCTIVQDADASPFRIVVDQEGAALTDRDYVMKADFHLKPWDHCNLTLRFKVDNGGVYAAPLICVVHDPFAPDADSEPSKKQAIKVFSGMLDGGAHSNECVATSPTVVDFGDLSVGRSLRQSVLLTNFFRHDLAVALAVDDGPFLMADSQTCALMNLPSAAQDPARRAPLDVMVRPGISRNYVRFCRIMSLSGPEEPKNLILRVRAGVCGLTTNFGNPSRVWTFSEASSEPTLESESPTCVDFGIIPTGRTAPARLDLILRNCGTRSVDVLRVQSKLARLRWSIETLPGHTAEQLRAPGITPSQLQRMRRLAVLGALLTHDEATDARVNAVALEGPDVVTHSASLPCTVDWDEVDFHLDAAQENVRRDLRVKTLRQMDQDRAQARSAANTMGKSVLEKSPSSSSRVDKESTRGGRDEETKIQGIEEDESENTLNRRTSLPHEPLEAFNGALARYGVGLAKPIETPLRLDPGKHVRISLQMDFEQGDTGAIDGDLEVHTDEPGAAASSIHVFRIASKFQPELVFDSSEISFGVVAAGSLGTGFLTIRNPGVVGVHWKANLQRGQSVLLGKLDRNADAGEICIKDKMTGAKSQGTTALDNEMIQDIFAITPAACTLDAGRSQRVKVVFKPTRKFLQKEIHASLIFKTSLLGSEQGTLGRSSVYDSLPVALHGATGAAAVEAFSDEMTPASDNAAAPTAPHLSFGCIQVGMRKSREFRLYNSGNMAADFVVERDPDANNVDATRFGNLFSFVPAVGIIQSGETRCVTVRYLANDQGLHDVTLHVTWNTHSKVPEESVPTDAGSNLIKIHCSGSGGLPQLHVRQARIKYEQAIVGVANLAHLQVFNYGTAECFVAFKMPIKSLHVSHSAEGICVPPRDSIQIPVIFTPTTLERVETTLVVHMIQDASVFYEVDVSAFVGVPDLSITPERALCGLDFDVALVKQTHVRSFTVTNIGDVGLDFACAFLRPTRTAIERHMRRASAIANGQRRNSLTHGPKRQSLDKSCRESWLDTYSFPDDFEDFVPEYLTVEPMEGTFSTGMMIHFTVSFTPLEREKESHAIFAIQNRFDTIKAEIRGVGGDPLLELDTPLRVIDFGLCEAGQAYERTIHVMNPGNVPYDFIVEPDPSDAELRATLLQFAHVAGEDSAHAERNGGAAGPSQKPRKSLVHGANELTEHLPRALAKFGFALETSGTCNAYGRSPVRFTFKVPETVNLSPSTRSSIFSAKIQLRHATGYEQLTLRAKEAFASLELHDTDQMPLQDTVVDFGISAVRQTHLRTVLLHNSGKLPAVFSIQSNASSEYAIFPRDGTVGPGESLPLQVSFAPTLSDRVEGNFVAIYNCASRLSIPVAGTGGKGVVDVEFVSERDKSMHGLDFQLVSTHVLMEKKVLLHNVGQVPLRLVCESTSPSYTIGSIRMTDVQAATPGYGSKFTCSNGEAERLGSQSSHGASQYASPMMIVPRKGRRGKSQQSQQLQKSYQQDHSVPQGDPGGSEVTSGRTGPGRGSIFLPSGDDDLLRAQSKLALDHYGKSGHDTEGHVVVECTLPPGFFAILRVRLFAEREITYAGMLKVRSEFDAKSIPLRARGGGVKLRHTGDLDFGQIACDHTYTRTITLSNSGSIPSSVEIYWKMKPSSREAFALSKAGVRSGTVLLKGSTTRLGLRRFWHWALENVLALVREARVLTGNQELTADQRDALLDPDADLEACLGLRDTTKRNSVAKISAGAFAHRKSQSAAAGTLSGLNEAFRGLQAAGETAGARVAQILDRFHKYQEIQLARQEDDARDLSEVVRTKDEVARDSRALREFLHASASRREHAAINAADVDPQQQFEKELEDSRFSLPHVQVTPRQGTLSERMSMDVTVTLNTSVEGSFEATLVVAPSLPGVGPYEIPVRAESQEVRIIVDDLGTINFGRQALGETKVIRRVFENQGSMAAEFRIRNTNADLVADPCDGVLEPGDVLAVDFVYSPSSEGICAHPVLFETNCTAPIVLDVYAGGGYPQLDLDHYESFDFGRCMVGKTIPKRLRIGNSGNAVLTITALNFEKHRRRTHAVFERGEGWPQELTSGQVLRIAPSESYYVPLVFHPNSESHFEEVFTIQTTVGSYSLHLFGSGREAVLSLSVHRIDFLDCIVGNAYQRSFEISNAGDLVYPLDISLIYTESNEPASDKKKAVKWTPLNDLKAEPQHLSIAPFEKRVVTVTYLPSKAVEESLENVRIALSSIYSNFDVPVRLHAGTADLVVDPPVFDFGHFQVSRPAPAIVTFSNAGTMGFGFRLKRVVDDLDMDEEGQDESSDVSFPFRLSRWEGYLPPGESVEIVATFVVGAKSGGDLERFLGSFHKEVHVETDLVGSSLVLVLRGKCDSSTLRSEEFDRVQMGACAVGDLVNKTVTIRNYGGYPAEISLQPSFPLKVAPKSLIVPGHGDASFVVSWKPLGGYELRGSIKAQSNVGLFDIQVSGIGVYPKFYIEGSKVDFGVCAPGVEYERSFVVRNTGKIKLEWSVPAVAPEYRVLPDTGVLDIRQSQTVVVFFKPVDLGRFPGDFIVESRGRYKIVSASGVGGVYNVQVVPETRCFDFGETPCGVFSWRTLTLTNRGTVPAELCLSVNKLCQTHARLLLADASMITTAQRIEPEEMEASKDELVGNSKDGETPLQVKLLPGQFSSIQVGVDPGLDPVDFAFTVHVDSAEAAERIAVKGTGHVIKLSPEARATLLQEHLTSLDMVEPCEDNSFGEGAQYSIFMHEPSARRVLAPVDVDDEASWRRLEICNLEPIDVARDLPRLDFILDAPRPFLPARPK